MHAPIDASMCQTCAEIVTIGEGAGAAVHVTSCGSWRGYREPELTTLKASRSTSAPAAPAPQRPVWASVTAAW